MSGALHSLAQGTLPHRRPRRRPLALHYHDKAAHQACIMQTIQALRSAPPSTAPDQLLCTTNADAPIDTEGVPRVWPEVRLEGHGTHKDRLQSLHASNPSKLS